jgi:superfamily II DNA or RNA helicase
VNDKLVLTVTQHRQFGWKINLYSASPEAHGVYRILGLPNLKEEIGKGASNVEISLIKAMKEVSDEALIKAYSSRKDKTKIPQSTIDNLIRPRIEKNCSKMIGFALEAGVPIFRRIISDGRILHTYNQLEILPESSYCLFNFIKDERGLRYFITLTNHEEEILLQQDPAIILSDEPCIVLLGNEIHRVENINSKKLLPFFSKTHIDVPAASEKMYIEKFILKTIPRYEVRIEGIEMEEKHPEKEAILVLEEDLYSQLCLSLYFRYDNRRFQPTVNLRRTRVLFLEEIDGRENICWFDRELEWENAKLRLLIDLGLQQKGDNHFYLAKNPEIIRHYGLISWLNLNLDKLLDFRIEQKTGNTYYRGTVELKSAVTEKIDWFDLEIIVILENFRLPFFRFRKHILNGNPEYVLPDGSIFILPEAWFQQYQELFRHTEPTESAIRLKKIHVPFLNSTIRAFFPEDRKKDLERFNRTPLEHPALPEHLDAVLRPYQKEGFYWLDYLRRMNFGGCLADDMGLGKTLQTITLFASIYSQAGKKGKIAYAGAQLSLFDEWESNLPASLVIVPASLLHNWQKELKKFAPELKVYIHSGVRRLKPADSDKLFNAYQVIISSYGIVRADEDYLAGYRFHYIVLDESQFVKNPDSATYKAIKNLTSSHKLTLTGTPIENSLSDLWAQFDFINPGLLGNLSAFKSHYVQKISKEKNKKVEESLLRMIQPFLLRRTKEEVTPELPSLSQEIVFCDMSEAQEEAYDSEKNSIRNKMLENKEHFIANNLIALQSLTRLRLLSNHPALCYPAYEGDSGKFNQIILYFETIRAGGHKVLIFSSFVKYLRLLSGVFDEKGWKYAMLTGQTTNREAEIERFGQNKEVNAFFISLKAGGTGLNLTEADYVFIVDPWWNPAAEMQALSRAHRIGQDKKVMVYRFISNDSIEEKIIRLQNSKIQLSETFVASNNPLNDLSIQEIEGLFE